MKKILLTLAVLCSASPLLSQVGINTTQPTATLDIDGNLRVRGIKELQQEFVATKILGVDDDGNFVEVEVGENVILENNTLRAVERRVRFESTTEINVQVIHNLSLVILPGDPNDDKRVMRIITNGGDVDITGIVAGEDGQVIWLLAYTGKVKLLGSNSGSDPENRFLMPNNIILSQFEMVQLVYDGALQKWLLMAN